jgi:hypothetical protein
LYPNQTTKLFYEYPPAEDFGLWFHFHWISASSKAMDMVVDGSLTVRKRVFLKFLFNPVTAGEIE